MSPSPNGTGTLPPTLQRVLAAVGDVPLRPVPARDGLVSLAVERRHLRAVLEALRHRAGFETNTFVTAIDHFPAEPRFVVVHQFLSLAHNDRVRLETRVPSEDALVPTCTDLWPGASFSERECFDLFGVRFEGHPDLRRLMMPEAYGHHPLRKDFPHKGIEPDRLYREWDRRRRQGDPTSEARP